VLRLRGAAQDQPARGSTTPDFIAASAYFVAHRY
jgi:hypothetical protein